MANYDDSVICVTCGTSPDMSLPNTGDWDAYGHEDSAHNPNWSDQPSEELDIYEAVMMEDYGRISNWPSQNDLLS